MRLLIYEPALRRIEREIEPLRDRVQLLIVDKDGAITGGGETFDPDTAQPDVDNAFKRWNIRWTILSPREPLVRQLDKRPGWRRVYADAFAVVHARADAVNPFPPPASPPPNGAR